MAFRKKFQLTLRAAIEPFASELTGANGDARLKGMVALAARIIIRIYKRHDAFALIVMEPSPHHLPGKREEHERKEKQNADRFGPDSYDQQHGSIDRQKTEPAA